MTRSTVRVTQAEKIKTATKEKMFSRMQQKLAQVSRQLHDTLKDKVSIDALLAVARKDLEAAQKVITSLKQKVAELTASAEKKSKKDKKPVLEEVVEATETSTN